MIALYYDWGKQPLKPYCFADLLEKCQKHDIIRKDSKDAPRDLLRQLSRIREAGFVTYTEKHSFYGRDDDTGDVKEFPRLTVKLERKYKRPELSKLVVRETKKDAERRC